MAPSSSLLVTTYGQGVEEWLHIMTVLNRWKLSLQKHLFMTKVEGKTKEPHSRLLKIQDEEYSGSLDSCDIRRVLNKDTSVAKEQSMKALNLDMEPFLFCDKNSVHVPPHHESGTSSHMLVTEFLIQTDTMSLFRDMNTRQLL